MSKTEFEKEIRKMRKNKFGNLTDFVYHIFENTDFHSWDEKRMSANASQMITELRSKCWEEYKKIEEEFGKTLLTELVDKEIEKLKIEDMPAKEFISGHYDDIYNLSLSNTQARRTRSGGEFETILEIALLWSGLPVDYQANIGLKIFDNYGLKKQMDLVVPGVQEFEIDNNKTVVISMKTTLRERHQEVNDEKKSVSAAKIYLATMDIALSLNLLKSIKSNNIILVTTKDNISKLKDKNKEQLDKKKSRLSREKDPMKIDKLSKEIDDEEKKKENIESNVIPFEELIKVCKDNMNDKWNEYDYSRYKDIIARNYNLQIAKHKNHREILRHYKKRIDKLGIFDSLNEDSKSIMEEALK